MARAAGSGLVAGSVASGLVAVKDPPPVRWRASAKEALRLARSVESGLVARSVASWLVARSVASGRVAVHELPMVRWRASAKEALPLAGWRAPAQTWRESVTQQESGAPRWCWRRRMRGAAAAQEAAWPSAAVACPTRTCVPRNLVLVTLLNRAKAG